MCHLRSTLFTLVAILQSSLKNSVLSAFCILTCGVVASCTTAPRVTIAVKHSPHSKPLKISSTYKSSGEVKDMGIEELFSLQQSGKVLIYDVRVPYFYQIDHIPGAINWPYTDYAAQVQTRDLEIQRALNAGKKIVVYCFNLGCPEARGVARNLARRDYKISMLTLGIDHWRSAGLPME
jgi:rhodanese-related sulfurtransferase